MVALESTLKMHVICLENTGEIIYLSANFHQRWLGISCIHTTQEIKIKEEYHLLLCLGVFLSSPFIHGD